MLTLRETDRAWRRVETEAWLHLLAVLYGEAPLQIRRGGLCLPLGGLMRSRGHRSEV